MVVIGAVGVAGGERRLVEGAVLGVELVIPEPPRADGAVGAVVGGVAVVGVGFEAAQEGQQGVVAPQVVARRRPRVVVLGHSPQEDLRVHRRRPADNFPARHEHVGAQVGRAGAVPPAEPGSRAKGAIPDIAVAPVGMADLLGQVFYRRKIRPGLQQQDRAARIFAQPRRKRRSGGTRPGNDGIARRRH